MVSSRLRYPDVNTSLAKQKKIVGVGIHTHKICLKHFGHRPPVFHTK